MEAVVKGRLNFFIILENLGADICIFVKQNYRDEAAIYRPIG